MCIHLVGQCSPQTDIKTLSLTNYRMSTMNKNLTSNAYLKHHNIVKYAISRTNWENFHQTVVDNPFETYCYSNVDEVTNKWYLWFNKLFTETVSRITSHRSYLPPWISKPPSHLINQLNTLKRKEARKAQPLNLQKILDLESKI